MLVEGLKRSWKEKLGIEMNEFWKKGDNYISCPPAIDLGTHMREGYVGTST